MRIVVLNNSGNVGKSTICNHLLQPRINNSEIIRVETLNNDGIATGERLSGENFGKIFNKIIITSNKNIIVDVGSSNIQAFYKNLQNDFERLHSFIDYFIVPITSDEKQQKDSIDTIYELKGIGIEDEKIKIIYNFFDDKVLIDEQFKIFIGECNLKLDLKNSPTIKKTNFFKTLLRAGIPYEKVKDDFRDFNKLIESAKSKNEIMKLELAKFYKLGFNAYHANLDNAFTKLSLDEEG